MTFQKELPKVRSQKLLIDNSRRNVLLKEFSTELGGIFGRSPREYSGGIPENFHGRIIRGFKMILPKELSEDHFSMSGSGDFFDVPPEIAPGFPPRIPTRNYLGFFFQELKIAK